MKIRVKTKLDRLRGDIETQGAGVLCEANMKNEGWFMVTLQTLDDAGSLEQNNAWHALLGEFWRSGLSSYQSHEDMRDKIKLRVAGARGFIYIDDKAQQHTTKNIDDIPFGSWYIEVPKSWADFTKSQRAIAIDDTISEMVEAGVSSTKFDEILEGMER